MSTDLCKAVRSRNVADVEALLADGADPNAYDKDSRCRVIELAAGKGYTEIVSLLLERGANIYRNDNGALREAVRGNHVETVEVLIDNNSTLIPCSLEYAADNGFMEIVKLFLQKGASTEEFCRRPYWYYTPEQNACHQLVRAHNLKRRGD